MPLGQTINRVLESVQQSRRDEQSQLMQLAQMKLQQDEARVNKLYDAYTRSQADEKNLMDQYLKTVDTAASYGIVDKTLNDLPIRTKDSESIIGLEKMRLAERAKSLKTMISKNRDDQQLLSDAILQLTQATAKKRGELLNADLAYRKALTADKGSDKVQKTNRYQNDVVKIQMSKIKSRQDKILASSQASTVGELNMDIERDRLAYDKYMELENTGERLLNMQTNLADEYFTFPSDIFGGLVSGNKVVEGISTETDITNEKINNTINSVSKKIKLGKIDKDFAELNSLFNDNPELFSATQKEKFGKLKVDVFLKNKNIKGKTVKRTGTDENGRKVIEYTDGSREYAE